MTDIVMAAGEASGDRLGAILASELLKAKPSLHIAGIGKERMRNAGVEMIADCSPLSVMGYWDVAVRLPKILSLRRQLMDEIRRRKPKLFIGIDAPDFNLGVAAFARSCGVKTVQYVSPSIWMWRAERADNIARAADAVWCLFPFEPAAYQNTNVEAVFTGHPDAQADAIDKSTARNMLNISAEEQCIVLMPGSRAAELRVHLPLFAEAVRLLQQNDNANRKKRFVAVAADEQSANMMRSTLFVGMGCEVVHKDAAEVLPAADAALVKSGTSVLQAALAKTPLVAAYKMSLPAYCFAAFRKFRLPFFTLPNILSSRFVAPELLQKDATPAALAQQVRRLLEDDSVRESQIRQWANIRRQLQSASSSAAQEALKML